MLRHRLTDQEWASIEDIFPPPARPGRPPRNRRQVVDAVLGVLRTGVPGRDRPQEFGPWATAWDLFDRWNADGTLASILSRLRSARIDAGAVDGELGCVDGPTVRAARCAAGGGNKGTPRGPRTTRWGAPAGALPPRSTCSAMVTATPATST